MAKRRRLSGLLTFRGMRDLWRSVLKVSVDRSLPPAGPLPAPGCYIARDDVRVPVTEGLTAELWDWLAQRGWREIDLASDRRRYRAGMPSAIEELLFAESERELERLECHIRETARMSNYELRRKPSPPRRTA